MPETREQLLKYLEAHQNTEGEPDVLENDASVICYMMDNCEISVPNENRFFVMPNTAGLGSELTWFRADKMVKQLRSDIQQKHVNTLAATGTFDISHTSPKWENVCSLGFVGLKGRVEELLAKCNNEAEQNPQEDAALQKKKRFYSSVLKIYEAIERFLERASQKALEHGKTEMAQGIANLGKRAPKNLFEALQLTLAYYVFQHFFEGTYLRTLGRIDSYLYPFFKKEDKNEARKLFADYFYEADRLKAPANIPFTLSCYDKILNRDVSELTGEILDVYMSINLKNTKFHLLCGKDTPKSILKKAFYSVQKGKNSIVFMNDEKVISTLQAIGASKEDASNYHVEGCYEGASDGEIPCTTNGRVSIPKALELAINKGHDMLTDEKIGLDTESDFNSFEELYEEFKNQLLYLLDSAVSQTNSLESCYNKLHCAPLLSSTHDFTLESGKDIYCDYGAKYNNSSINAIGIATATDSLVAVKKLVYDEKRLTLQKLCTILKSNWEGEEALRLYAKNKLPKYGNANNEADSIAKDIVDTLSTRLSKTTNVKGGKWRLGLFSIDWRWEFGKKCEASADGRRRGETLSQNTSASFGADREGATAHLQSVAGLDALKTSNGMVADIDLHTSAVRGEAGNEVLCALATTYFDLGGYCAHFNVLDTEILKKAKDNPELYPDLQVRLCGWNVLFSSLSQKEKEEFIARSEK